MPLALLHRRLTVAMALAALAAYTAGVGLGSVYAALAAAALVLALVWQPSAALGRWVERLGIAVAAAMLLWAAYLLSLGIDFLPPMLGLVLVLIGTEALKPLDARNDMRLYGLSFALLIASTAYYPGILFGLSFVAYVVLGTLALMVGHLRRQAEHFGVASIRIRRPFLTATAALSVITVLMSLAVFLAFPRLPRTWSGPRLRASDVQMAGFSEDVSLAEHGSRIYPNPAVVLRVEFPDQPARSAAAGAGGMHWRGRSYDHFDGVRWSRSRFLPPTARAEAETYLTQWGPPFQRQKIYGGPLDAKVLFGLHPVVQIEPQSKIRPITLASGDFSYWGSDAPVYTVSTAARPAAAALQTVPVGGAPPASGFYLQTPRDLSPRFRALADSLVRGHATRYDRVVAVQHWLQTEFRYTLDLPSTAREARLEFFVFQRRAGHCEYFSTAMAMLLRSAGIPARNVNGFLGGEWNPTGNFLAVTQNSAHSWVEVWFPGYGWVPFDPTPAGGGLPSLADEVGVGSSWTWPARFWFDGMQHRWYRWVIDYNLEKQIAVFREVGDFFAGETARTQRGSRLTPLRRLLPWFVGLGTLALLLWYFRPHRLRRRRASRETRLYLALRRRYQRAGYPEAATPLNFLQTLRQADAPGLPHAEALVALYLRARFAGENIGDAGRQRMQMELDAARRALRTASRRRTQRAETAAP